MIELIPAIDIINGKCVRLTQGNYESCKIYDKKPLEVAKEFEANGIRRLHIVDLDGAISHHIVNYKVLEQIALKTTLSIDFGGGIKSDEDLKVAFDSGAQMVTVGSIAIKCQDLFLNWLDKYGNERIILGADVKDTKISVNGWQEESSKELFPFLKEYVSHGVHKVICTDIERDGMLQGPSVKLYKEIIKQFPSIYIIASGGIGSVKDIETLDKAGIPAVIFGKAFYEGKITWKELSQFI